MKMFIAWLVAFMVSQSPPGAKNWVPEAQETKEEAETRYEAIATDVVTVVSEEDSLFAGPTGRIKTASVIMSIMRFESGFRKDVDLGVGKLARGDSGRSVCMMQLNIGAGRTFDWNKVKKKPALPADPADEVELGWTQKEILADRKRCIRAGYRIIKMSFGATRGQPVMEWLRVYASGKPTEGSRESQARMGLALKYFGAHRPDFTDTVLSDTVITDTVEPAKIMTWPWPYPKHPFIRSIGIPLDY